MAIFRKYLRLAGTLAGRRRPVYVHYGVTHRCNLRCRMCSVWQTAAPGDELKLPQIQKLARSLRELGVIRIALGGGEPFLRKDLTGVVEAFSSNRMEVHVLTNGCTATEKDVREVVKAGLSGVSISLDTLDPGKAEYIFGSRRILEKVFENLSLFSRLMPERGATLIMNVVVSRQNLSEIPALARFAVAIGYKASFIPVTLAPSPNISDGFAAYAPEFTIGPGDHELVDSIYAFLLKRKRESRDILNSSRFLRDSAHYLKTGEVNWKCHAGSLYLSVSPEGIISFCHKSGSTIGAWSDNLAGRLREEEYNLRQIKFAEACPGCMRPCWAEVSHAFTDLRSAGEAAKLYRSNRDLRHSLSAQEIAEIARDIRG